MQRFSYFFGLAALLFLATTASAAPVRFARAVSLMSLPILIAEEKGYFGDEGLEIDFVSSKAGFWSMKMLMAGEVDIAVAGTPPVVKLFMDGQKFCIACNLTEADDAQVIITSKSGGLRTADELRGKRVGLPFGTGADYSFREYLFFNGLERGDLELVNLPPDALANGLQANNLDALVLWEPPASRAREALGEDYYQLSADNTMLLEYPMAVTPDFARQRHGDLVKVLKALHRANKFIAANPEETILLQSRFFEISPEKSAQILEDQHFQLTIGNRLLHAFERVANMVREDSGGVKEIPDFGTIFCEQALLEVAPENFLLNRK